MYGILLVDQFPVSNKEWRALQNEYFEEFMESKLPECYIPRPPHAVSTYSRSVFIDQLLSLPSLITVCRSLWAKTEQQSASETTTKSEHRTNGNTVTQYAVNYMRCHY